ncbi:glutamate decarboxylase [Stratiformator vulcanicus]|uniref:Glutamate decarboxylase n=1 Tax=Stratiformator vulcanicus TaxID=2527980 RepID=A0A517QW88_9PLAN|nr:glutamate decarboxylase [Stratiformator vulcanicus]QDT35929.1 Glutamate decarboxylase alpha [Stratiformator vulcanicus]
MLHENKANDAAGDTELTPVYGRRAMDSAIPKYELPQGELDPETAYDLIHDELMLDGNARLNLATFVTTWMEPQAEKLMAETFDKNMIDKDEYPFTAKIEERCVNIVSRLFHAPTTGVGASAIGSSEAVMLAGMAFKWRWRERQAAAGKPTDRPNIVMGNNVQVVWEKFARYWEVEPRYIEMEPGQYEITPEAVLDAIDENTICVVAILGVTYTGAFEPIEDIHAALVEHHAKTGLEIPMHVDAASGGFVAPFLQPDLMWDFRLPLVKSINVSGHKYGLVYPGVGWVVWRSKEELPEDLIFHVNYLGGDMPTFTLNFSRPGNQVIGQYYNFLRLGRDGYTKIMESMRETAVYLSGEIEKLGPFELLSRGDTIPVFAFMLKNSQTYTVFDLSDKLREHGWQVPAYTMPPKVDDLAVLRICVREGFSRDLADMLLADLKSAVAHFESQPGYRSPYQDRQGKVHKNC